MISTFAKLKKKNIAAFQIIVFTMLNHLIISIITPFTNYPFWCEPWKANVVLDFQPPTCWFLNAWTLRNSLKIWNGKYVPLFLRSGYAMALSKARICLLLNESHPDDWNKKKRKYVASFCIQHWVPF